MGGRGVHLVFLLVAAVASPLVESLPLSTRSRWIVDDSSGHRVKLHCINWAGHMEAMLVEGLDRKPVGEIASHIASLGFNCVRLTWATYMFTESGYGNRTVAESLTALGLNKSLAGVAAHNPALLNLTLIKAQEAVVDALGEVAVMVVLDNHVSRPQWCCAEDDGNGFFGDEYFDPEEWIQGLRIVAGRYRGRAHVVGMSLRNELRGSRSNATEWYEHMNLGASAIHRENPNVLVIFSALGYSTDFSFLARRPLRVEAGLEDKLVYEAHWYSFSNGKRPDWETRSPSWVCSTLTENFQSKAGFIVDATSKPLFLSEFGVDQLGLNLADNRFLTCFFKYAAERDLDWGLWALQGSYYRKSGKDGLEENYGVLDVTWDGVRNPKLEERYRLLQEKLQDPGSLTAPYTIIFHPLTGHCLEAKNDGSVESGDCISRSRWTYRRKASRIKLQGSNLCLKSRGQGQLVELSPNCSDWQSLWTPVATSQLAASDPDGGLQCLERSSSGSIFTTQCICLEGTQCDHPDPQAQWFILLLSNV